MLLMPMMAFAQYIDEKKAREIAASVLKENAVKTAKRAPNANGRMFYNKVGTNLELHRVVKNDKGDLPCFYIYNQKGGAEGFAIVSNQGQLLAYSDHGIMDYDNAPDNVKWLLEQYRRSISINNSSPYPEGDEGNKNEGYKSLFRHDIEPLIGSNWHQAKPFNNIISEKYYASGATADYIFAGCTTIAMAQVMLKWKHPTKGKGINYFKVGKNTNKVDFEEPIDWKHIVPKLRDIHSDESEAISDFCYKVAASLDSEVKDGETSAFANNILKALKKNFDYDSSIRDEPLYYYSGEVTEDIAYTELEQDRPCILYGQDFYVMSVGHTMAVEGYDADKNLFFINMGDDEVYNTYYRLTSGHRWVFWQHIITHIKPNQGGSQTPHIYAPTYAVLQPADNVRPHRAIEYDKSQGQKNYHVSAQIFSNDMDAEIVTGMIAKDFITGKECVFEGPTFNLIQGYIQDLSFDIDLSKIEYNGYYQLRPVFRMADGDEWFSIEIMRENEEESFQPVCVDVSNANVLDFGIAAEFVLGQTTISLGNSVQIDCRLPIMGVPVTFTSSDPSVASVDEDGVITAHQPGEVTITVHCDDYYYNGNRLVKETTAEYQIIGIKPEPVVAMRLLYVEQKECEYGNHDCGGLGYAPVMHMYPQYLKTGSFTCNFGLAIRKDNKLVRRDSFWYGWEFVDWKVCTGSQSGAMFDDLEDGDYQVSMDYQVGDSEWIPCVGSDTTFVDMKIRNGKAYFTNRFLNGDGFTVDGMEISGRPYIKHKMNVNVTATNNTLYPYHCIFLHVNDSVVGVRMFENMETGTTETKPFTRTWWNSTYDFVASSTGPHTFSIVDGDGNVVQSETIDIISAPHVKLTPIGHYFSGAVDNLISRMSKLHVILRNDSEYAYDNDLRIGTRGVWSVNDNDTIFTNFDNEQHTYMPVAIMPHETKEVVFSPDMSWYDGHLVQASIFYFSGDDEVRALQTPFYTFVDNTDYTVEYDPEKEQKINGNFEGSDFSCFAYKNFGAVQDITASDIVVDNGNHCLKIVSQENVENTWDSQFFIKLPDGMTLPPRTVVDFSMRVKASRSTTITTQGHDKPEEYLCWGIFGDIGVSTDWVTVGGRFTIPDNDTASGVTSGKVRTIAFDLNCDLRNAIEFYFDDISITTLTQVVVPTVAPTRIISIEDMSIKPGETKDLTVSMLSDVSGKAGVQFNITLPNGFTLEPGNNGQLSQLSANQPNDMTCSVSDLGRNTFHFVLSSKTLKPLKAGELITLHLRASKEVPLGCYSMVLNGIAYPALNGYVTTERNMKATVKLTSTFMLTYLLDGAVYKTAEIEYGTYVSPEAEPTKEGYTFSGWSKIPSTMPAEDVTVTGTFTVNKYKLTYMIDDKVYKEVEVEYGATITPEPQPEGDYVSFSWTGLPETMPAKDVTVQADYVTGINGATLNDKGQMINDKWYDLKGRRISQPKKGVNILRDGNGKTKVIVVK